MFEEIMATVLGKGIGYSLMVVTAMILFDAIFGVLISVKTKTFDLGEMKRFVATNVLPYIGGLVLMAVCAMFVSPEAFGAFYSIAVVSVGVGYLKSLYAKGQELFAVKFTYDCIECGENFPYDEEAFTVSPGPRCPQCRGSDEGDEEGGDGD